MSVHYPNAIALSPRGIPRWTRVGSIQIELLQATSQARGALPPPRRRAQGREFRSNKVLNQMCALHHRPHRPLGLHSAAKCAVF